MKKTSRISKGLGLSSRAPIKKHRKSHPPTEQQIRQIQKKLQSTNEKIAKLKAEFRTRLEKAIQRAYTEGQKKQLLNNGAKHLQRRKRATKPSSTKKG